MNNDWETDPIFPFSIDSFTSGRKEARDNSRYHILYLDEGRIFYKKPGGFIIFNQKGFLVIPPFWGHLIRLDSESRGYEIIVSRVLFDELTIKIRDRLSFSLLDNVVSFFYINEKEDDIFYRIMENILSEWKEKKSGFKDILRLKMIELFINLSRIKTVVSPREGGLNPDTETPVTNKPPGIDIHTRSNKIEEILSYLDTNYCQSLTLDELARENGFSTSYLSRYFKHKTGLCLFEYINKLRVRRACFLLKNTNKKIIEIAYEVGYNNISFFNRYFKKILKISPVEYRKK
ncbi:MAG: helix-turn-helix transcriptional regulator [Spirochaetales bacterium]|nr:helix-turn-helix transcriptional regulator [Spirochaetales bacterium]